MKINQNIKEIENNITNQFEDFNGSIEEYIAGSVLYHHNHIEDLSEAAQRHDQSEKEELLEIIEEVTMNTLGELDEKIQKKVFNLLVLKS